MTFGNEPSLDAFPEGVVVDTVVVHYFTMLGRFRLLAQILGGVVQVPRAVYDPADEQLRDAAGQVLSELEQGRRFHRRRATNEDADARQRERSKAALPHFDALGEHVQAGRLVTLDLSEPELRTYADLRNRVITRQYGLLAGLGRGESAALALAEARGMRLATDDQDCIKVASARNKAFQPLRIRSLLGTAVEHGLLALTEARSIHLSMVGAGFWDRGRL